MKKIISLLTAFAVAVPMSFALLSMPVTTVLAAAPTVQASAPVRHRHIAKVPKKHRVPKVHTHNKEKFNF